MLINGIIYLVLTWVTFKKYPSIAMILVWLFAGLGLVLNLMGATGDGFMFLTFIFAMIVLGLTAIVTNGGKNI